MDLLLVGLSGFARRRVLPAVAATAGIEAVHVASRGADDAALAEVPRRGRRFRDYAEGIAATPPGLVYVSLTNDAHERWALAALDAGHHVIVDKPAFTTLEAATRLVARARAAGLILAEATTYAFHPLHAAVRAVFAEHGSAPTLVTCAFTPPLPAASWRFRRGLGGGAFLDTGPYFASLGRVIWGATPEWLAACVVSAGDEVETAFSVAARYGAGRALVGHFGFTTEYGNHVHLAGPALAVDVPGIFSTPPERATELLVRHRDARTTRVVPPASAMQLFLAAVLDAIARGDGGALAAALLDDAGVLDRLRREAAPQLA
jgi:predicted dehydrogenase